MEPKKSHIHCKYGFSFNAQQNQQSKFNNYTTIGNIVTQGMKNAKSCYTTHVFIIHPSQHPMKPLFIQILLSFKYIM
jgi:hypothetical protein